MTNPVYLSNVKCNLSKKSYAYSYVLSCCGVELLNTENNTNTFSVPENVDKSITHHDPQQPINAPLSGGSVELKWKFNMKKKSGDSKPYDHPLSVPVNKNSTPYTVLLGKVGNITFTASVPDGAELKRQEEAKRQEAERQRQEAERQRQEAEREAERQRLEQEKLEAERKEFEKKQEEALAAGKKDILKWHDEFKATLWGEMDYSESQIMSAKVYLKKLQEEEQDRIIQEAFVKSFPALNPELRIAKLFQEPLIEQEDPIYEAICAKPNAIPPATNSRPDDIYSQSTISPDPYNNKRQPSYQRQQQQNRSSLSPGRGNNNSPARNQRQSPSRSGQKQQQQQSQQVNRMTPLDLLHQKNSDPDELAAHDPAKRRFGASTFDEDFGDVNENHATPPNRRHILQDFEDDEDDFENGPYSPDNKLYRMNANPLGTLRQDHSASDLPPLESLPKIKRNELNNATNNNASSPSKKGVTFSDQSKNEVDSGKSSSTMLLQQEPLVTSPQQKYGKNQQQRCGSQAKDERENVRFEMDLDPPPALMTALLHLSRDGGNMSATIPIDHQTSFLSNNNNRSSVSPLRGNNDYVSPSPISRRAADGGVSPSNHRTGSPSQQHGANRENSMTPRRKLPLVYTNIGEVVSKTRRHDDRAAPSFMRQKEIRLQADDPAQSYWNCFAPQKAQNLVGVRMPATAVNAFEEAATSQIAAASPPRRVTGTVPNAPRNLRTSVPPKNSLRIVDGGESSAHRASRRW